MPNPTPVATSPQTAPNQGVPQGAPASKEAPIADPKAKAPEAAANAAIAQGVAAEKAAVNQGADAVRKFKLKVDGREEEIGESEMIMRAQKGTAAERRMEEAQKMRAQNEAFVKLLKTDFTKLLDDPNLGLDEEQKRTMLEQYYKRKYIDPSVLTPEQQKQRANEERLAAYEAKEKADLQQAHQSKLDQLEAHHRENYQKVIISALETGGLPKTDFTVRRMCDLMAKNLQMGLDLAPEHLAKLVREDYENETKTLYSATDGETLLKLLGDDIANKIRKADLARLKAGMPNVPSPTLDTPKTLTAPEAPKKPLTMDQMREERDRKAREAQAAWKK